MTTYREAELSNLLAIIVFGLLFLGMGYCVGRMHNRPSSVASDQWQNVITNTARQYFSAGVKSAISAHIRYCIEEYRGGRKPRVSGVPDNEWEIKAYRVWINTTTNSEPYLLK